MSNNSGQNKKRRKRTGGKQSDESNSNDDNSMKLLPENDTKDSDNLLNGHVLNEQEKEMIKSCQGVQGSYLVGDRCHQLHKSRMEPAIPTSIDVSVTTNTSSSKSNLAQTCNCKSCLERRYLEAEQMLDNQLRHAWTQVRHLVRCAYHDPLVLTSVNVEEFKAYVELLVAEDPHLLFQRIESQAREYVNDIKTRLLKQLTNGYNTPQLACSFVNTMFNEFAGLLATARTVASFISHLEECHLSKFNNVSWEQHNMFLYQNMVHSEKVIQRSLTEVMNQLKQGSTAQVNSRLENLCMTTLLKYLKFDTEMTQISVAWRDVQQLMDEFNDKRLDQKRRKRDQPRHSEATWEVFRAHQSSFEQLFTNPQKEDTDSRLSLTLRQCNCSASLNTDTRPEELNENGKDIRYEINLTSEANQTNNEDSRHDHDCIYAHAAPEKCMVSFLTNDYLRDIKPPSVPSDDGDSINSDDEAPPIVEHPGLVVPSDLDGELDSLDSPSPQQSGEIGHNPFLQFDNPNQLLFNTARSFILPTFHHAPPYHLHHLGKNLQHPDFKDPADLEMGPDPGLKEDDSVNEEKTQTDRNEKFDPSSSCHPEQVPRTCVLGQFPPHFSEEDSPVEVMNMKKKRYLSRLWSDSDYSLSSLDRASTNRKQIPLSCVSGGAAMQPPEDDSSFTEMKKKRFVSLKLSSDSDSMLSIDPTLNPTCSHKEKKLKKKLHRKTAHTNNSQLEDVNILPTDGSKELVGTPSPNSSHSGSEKGDADDEYDDDDDDGEEQDDSCKCDRCLHFSRTSELTRDYLSDSKPYLSLPVNSNNSSGNPCECQSCLRLAAVSLFATQSGQTTSSLAGYPMNEGQSTLQPHFYNPMQDLRSMIHPHLYGLPTNLGSLAHTSDSSSLPSSGGSEIPTSTDPLQTPTSSTWDFLGKMQTGKQNFTDWSVPPQGWLNGGSNSSILSPQLVTPNSNLSAFQHYLNNTSMAGGAFLQPFVPGAVPLPHGVAQGVHPQSVFLPTTTEEDRIFSHLGTSGEKNTSVSEHQISEPSFTISLPTSVTNSRGNPHVTPNPMFPNYFSSIYAPMPDIGVNYTYTRSDPGVGGSPQAGSQPLRFHPGTSVSLKDGQFNLVRGSEPSPMLFNSQFSGSEKTNVSPPNQHSFINTSQTTCLQHNPFLQHNPSTSDVHGPGLAGNFLPVLSSSNTPTGVQSNLGIATSASTSTASQIQQQILRRKKLVAQSKLSKQPRTQSKPADPQNPTLQLKGLPTPLNPGAIAQPPEQFPPVPPPTEPQPAETRPPRPDTPTANRRTRPPRGSTPPPIPTTKKQPQPQPPLQNPTTCSDSACQHSHGGNSGSTTPTQTNGSNNGNCKYCNCCYCELFGNGGPPQAPVSKNFQEIRARLRRKLKKGKSDGGSDAKDEGRSDNDNVLLETSSPVHHSPEHLLPPQKICDQQQPSLDELVSFIEGQKISEEERSKKAAKRARQKQRKETDKKKSDLVEKQIDPIPETQRMEVEMSKEEELKYPKDHGGAEGDKNGRKKKKKKAKEVQEEEFYSQKPAQKNSSGDLKLQDKEPDDKVDGRSKQQKSKPPNEIKKVVKSIEDTKSLPPSKSKSNIDNKQARPSAMQLGNQMKPNPRQPDLKSPDGVRMAIQAVEKSFSGIKISKTQPKQQQSPVKPPHKGKSSEIPIKIDKKVNSLDKPVPKSEPETSNFDKKQHNQKMDQKPSKEPPKQTQAGKQKPQSTTKVLEKPKNQLLNGVALKPENNKKPQKSQQVQNNHITKTPQKDPSDSSNTTSESSTPEKSQDVESKNRARKHRRKNRLNFESKGGAVVDQVFMPKVEEDVNDMDDTEKEIESFKRFCMDSSTLIKPKKLTVNWKDFTFKKNHSAH